MKTLLKNTAIFVLPLLIMMFIADRFLSYYLRHSNQNEYSVWNDLYHGNINTDIAIYGSSRAMVHLNPRIFKDSLNLNAYNLGLNGHNFWLQYYRHKELLAHNKAPDVIIHSVDMFTLVKRKDLFQMEQFLPYMLYNRDLEKWIGSYQGFTHYDFNIPLIRFYGQYKAITKAFQTALKETPSNDSLKYKGFMSKNLIWNDDLVKARKRFPDFRIQIDKASVELFDKYLMECKQSGIHVILVYSPEYIEGQNFVKNRNEIISMFSVFAAKYNIPFLDYSNDSISFNKSYFYNASHLNGKGAAIFTSKFIHDMKRRESIAWMFRKHDDLQEAILEGEKVEIVLN
ncbi:MAG TPA: hypothetical protein VK212_08630 [Lentimicrobium sp.]|nr:hypothetical protein [Lentimicrobium sp.]